MNKNEFYEAGKIILSKSLHLESPSVRNPSIEEITNGFKMCAGNAVLHLYDNSTPEGYEQWGKDKAGANELGSLDGHFVTDNVLHDKHIGWYLTAKTDWQK